MFRLLLLCSLSTAFAHETCDMSFIQTKFSSEPVLKPKQPSVTELVRNMYEKQDFALHKITKIDAGKDGFQGIYSSGSWVAGQNKCLSGYSDPASLRPVMDALAFVIDKFGVMSMADVPCGDMCYMTSFLNMLLKERPNFQYTGADIVEALIKKHNAYFAGVKQMNFNILDATRQAPAPVDLIWSRAMTQHLTNDQTLAVLRNFNNSGAKYLVLRHYPNATVNKDLDKEYQKVGGWREQDFTKPPYSLNPPLKMFYEHEPGVDAHLAVWSLPIWS